MNNNEGLTLIFEEAAIHHSVSNNNCCLDHLLKAPHYQENGISGNMIGNELDIEFMSKKRVIPM